MLPLFSKSKKTIIFEPKLVKYAYIVQNFAKRSPKTTKNGQIFLKNLYFLIYVAFGAQNL